MCAVPRRNERAGQRGWRYLEKGNAWQPEKWHKLCLRHIRSEDFGMTALACVPHREVVVPNVFLREDGNADWKYIACSSFRFHHVSADWALHTKTYG